MMVPRAASRGLPLAALLLARWAAAATSPIVGVLSVPQFGEKCETLDEATGGGTAGGSCFSALYVKYIEAAGGRVVPLLYDWSDEALIKAFTSVNAVFFTGGEVDIRHTAEPAAAQYLHAATLLFNLTIAANNAGDYTPLWGTCMGFQTLSIVAAGDQSVLDTYAYDSEDLSLPLDVTPAAASSRLFRGMPAQVFGWMTAENITSNLHHDGVAPATYAGNEQLSSFFSVLSTNVDKKGKPFVSTVEAKEYPIYAVQWHPERPLFYWEPDESGIDHGPHAIWSMQYFANFLINEARGNEHQFPSLRDEQDALIYNYVAAGHSSAAWYLFAPAGDPSGDAGRQGETLVRT